MEAKHVLARADVTISNAASALAADVDATSVAAAEVTALREGDLRSASTASTACCTDPANATPQTVCHAHIKFPS